MEPCGDDDEPTGHIHSTVPGVGGGGSGRFGGCLMREDVNV